ncbi:Macrophage colony-stimulating factor 1 [Lemmus lemmus]
MCLVLASAGLSAQLGQENHFSSGSLLFFQACVRTFRETPLQLLEKIKDVFNKTKTLLEKDWNIFSKNCNKSFAKCSSQGQEKYQGSKEPHRFVFYLLVPGIILVLLAVGGLLFYRWKWRVRRTTGEGDILYSRLEDSQVPTGSSVAGRWG